MSVANEADKPLNIQNLKMKYDQYSTTLNDLRDPNNPSFTNSQIRGVESATGQSSLLKEYYVSQGADLKEQLIQIITSNRQTGNLEKATFADVDIKESSDEEESLIDSVPVTREQLVPQQTLTTDITEASLSNHPLYPNFNYLEEGLYKRDEIQIKKQNLELFQKRLLLQKQQEYFDLNGDVRNDAPTLRHIPQPFQQSPVTSYGNTQVTTFVPASLWKIDNSNTARHIRVEINKVRFTSHELSSDQDLLSIQLKQLYDSYMNDIQFPKTEYFAQKVQALREELKRRPEKEQDLLGQIIECHENRDIEEQKMGEKRDALLECWHMLKDARDKSKPTTKLCLKWKARKFSETEKEEEEQLFEQTLIARAKEQKRYNYLLTGNKQKTRSILAELKTQHSDMGLRMPGDTKWIPVLDTAPKANLKELSDAEQKRYSYLENTRISVVFWMGVYEIRSDDVPISSEFVAKTDVGCHAVVLHPPPGVKIHIFESGKEKRHEVATVTLPIFNGEPPVFNEYEFSSSIPLENGRIVQGYVEGRCFIEPDPESLETITKDTRYKYLGNLKNGRKVPIRMTNKMINELIDKHDPNDPYLTTAIATMKAHETNEKTEISFALDKHKEATLFASMAASDIWKQIPNRAYDLIRPNEPTTQTLNIEEETPKLFDIVTQPPSFSFSSLFNSFIGLFKRKKNRSVILMNQNGSDRITESSTILLHFHRLLLSSSRYPENTRNNSKAKYSKKPNIFIRVSLQGVEHATMTIQGNDSATDFDKQIELKLVQEGTPIPNYKQIESKLIRIDLFDQFSKDENQFLGTLQISLRCIFVNERISGVYPITMPPFMMDHIVENLNSQLALSIRLKPKLILEKPVLPSPVAESTEVNKRAHQIWNDLNYEIPDRNYSILVMTNEGKSVLPCRMISPQHIPEIKDFSQLLAFVSMIPTNSTIDNTKSHVYWCTSSEILKNNWGTNIEHALLFCNLLLGQKVDAYVVIGKDMISGYNAYVLVVEDNPNYDHDRAVKAKKKKETLPDNKIHQFNRTLFNPTDGTIYQINSQYITLIDVATVFNNKNIWFNHQSNQIPVYNLDWDLTNTSKWTSFFDETFGYVDFDGVKQPEDLPITEANEELVLPIRKKVSKIVKSTVSNLRPGTKWAKTIKPFLRSLLNAKNKNQKESPDFDDGTFRDLLDRTKREFRDYRIVGSPFFVSYVYDEEANDDILQDEIYDEIKKRDLCNCKPAIIATEEEDNDDEEDIVFSHCVEVRPFPNNIFAIWIFLVALHPTDGSISSEPIHSNDNSNSLPRKDSSRNHSQVEQQNDYSQQPSGEDVIEEEESEASDVNQPAQVKVKQSVNLPKPENKSDEENSYQTNSSSSSSAKGKKQRSPKHSSSEDAPNLNHSKRPTSSSSEKGSVHAKRSTSSSEKVPSPVQAKRSTSSSSEKGPVHAKRSTSSSSEKVPSQVQTKKLSSSEKSIKQSSSSSPEKESKRTSSKLSSSAKHDSPTKLSSSEKIQQAKNDSESSDSSAANLKKIIMLGEVLADKDNDEAKKPKDHSESEHNLPKQMSSNAKQSSNDEPAPTKPSSGKIEPPPPSKPSDTNEQAKQPLRDIKQIIKSRIHFSDSEDSSDVVLSKVSSKSKMRQSDATTHHQNIKRPISASRKKKNDDDDSGAGFSSPIMKTKRRGKSRQQPKKQHQAQSAVFISDSDE